MIQESSINVIAEGTRLEGKIYFDHVSRVHGELKGEIFAKEGSTLILSETAYVEGDIHADTLIIDGFVQGNIEAKSKVVLSTTGRVIGNITAPSLSIGFGAFFEGESRVEKRSADLGAGV